MIDIEALMPRFEGEIRKDVRNESHDGFALSETACNRVARESLQALVSDAIPVNRASLIELLNAYPQALDIVFGEDGSLADTVRWALRIVFEQQLDQRAAQVALDENRLLPTRPLSPPPQPRVHEKPNWGFDSAPGEKLPF